MKRLTFLFVITSLIFFTGSVFSQNLIKAKIAILHKSGEDYNALHNHDRLHVGDLMRIFVIPLNECYSYIIHSDDKEATILFNSESNKKLLKDDTLILPSPSEFYTFDNKSPSAEVIIFCSRNKLSEINNIFKNNSTVSVTEWNKIGNNLIKKFVKEIKEKTEKPFPIAGNVGAVNDDFIDGQLILSGECTLIRKYKIEIKE
jgi:hypothetical protein